MDNFAEKLFILNGASYDPECIGDVHYETVEFAKDLTRYVNYDCDFVDGVCKSNRLNSKFTEEPDDIKMCCCIHCRHSIGYTRQVISPQMYDTIKTLYNEETGFWTENGCSLPRKYRSETCLTYSCSNHTEYERILFTILSSFRYGSHIKFIEKYYEYITKKPLKSHFENVFTINVLLMEMLRHIEENLKTTYKGMSV